MMPLSVEEIKQRSFSKHTASYEKRGDMEIVKVWEPGSCCYWIDYWFSNGTLAVHGDCGEAVYMWHSSIGNIRPVAGCSLDYFAEKCRASPCGPGFKTWNREVAEDNLKDLISQKEEPPDPELARDAFTCIDTQYEWAEFLSDHGDDVIGSDSWECSDIGMTVDVQCCCHLAGLKRAFEVLGGEQ